MGFLFLFKELRKLVENIVDILQQVAHKQRIISQTFVNTT